MRKEIEQFQGDEEVLEKLSSYLNSTFPRLSFRMKISLKELFPEPENRVLRSFWGNSSHADVSVFRHGELVCILEPGGSDHFKDEKQKIRDGKKDRICQENSVNILRVGNDFTQNLNRKIARKLLKKYFYGKLRRKKDGKRDFGED